MGSSYIYCKLGSVVVRCPCQCAANDGGCGNCPIWYYYVIGIIGGIAVLSFLCWMIGCFECFTSKKKETQEQLHIELNYGHVFIEDDNRFKQNDKKKVNQSQNQHQNKTNTNKQANNQYLNENNEPTKPPIHKKQQISIQKEQQILKKKEDINML